MKTQEKKLKKLTKKQMNKIMGGDDGGVIDRDKKKKLKGNGNN